MAIPRSPLLLLLLLLLLLCHLHFSTQEEQQAQLILEEGYTVTTVLDGNKLPHPINPTSVLPSVIGGTHGFVVLDSPKSVFYTVSFPISQDSEVRRYSGNETSGFADGDLGSAMFGRPRSFAVDLKGNVYVADKTNHAIRKITASGVTTIAGGHTGKTGNVDGPGQYASFSEDFELAFVPQICALLISDRGNRLVRQMNLKSSDCESGSHWLLGASGSVLLGVSCLILGSVLTLAASAAYPFIRSCEVIGNHRYSEIWKHYQIQLERQVVTACSGIRSVVASSTIYLLMCRIVRMGLSHLSLMFNIPIVDNQMLRKEQVSLFNSDVGINHETTKSDIMTEQLKDLVSLDENVDVPEAMTNIIKQERENDVISAVSVCSYGGIDAMIRANILEFANQPTQTHPLQASPLEFRSGLVKRK